MDMAAAVPLSVTILCVGEESSDLHFRRSLLEQHGYRVLTATTAGKALQLFRSTPIQLVVTSEMPEQEVEQMSSEIKRISPEVPILYFAQDGNRQGPAQIDRVLSLHSSSNDFIDEVNCALIGQPRLQRPIEFPGRSTHPRTEVPPSEPLLASIVESSDDAIFSKTLEGTITSWNRAAEKMYGYSASEVLGRSIRMLIPRERQKEFEQIMERLGRGERIDHFNTQRIAKDGRLLDVSLSISPVKDASGKITGAATIARDVTPIKRAEQAIRNSEKLASAGRMAATVAHEINNPLEAIGNILYLLEHNPSLDQTAQNFVRAAQEELRRVTQITRLTLGLHRDRGPQVSDVRIPDLIDNTLALFGKKIERLGITVVKEYRAAGVVRGNAGELRQVFSNLVINAVEALAGVGDRLVIHLTERRHPRFPDRNGLFVTIGDNGIGMDKAVTENLFQPFFTTKGEKGTGIGLWVSRGIIEKHGGYVRVRSTRDPVHHGTVFEVFLPLNGMEAER